MNKLCTATKNGNLHLVSSLIKEGADINMANKDQHGCTPLHVACKKRYFNIAKILIENGADVNAANSNGSTPLHLILKEAHTDKNRTKIVDLLIENKADLNIACNYKLLPLLLAVAHREADIVALLKKNGAKLFAPDDNGETWSYLVRKSDITLAKSIIDNVLLQNPEEKKPSVIQQHEELSGYWDEYKTKLDFEILSFKKITFGQISLFDFYIVENLDKLTVMSRNKKAQKIIDKPDFIAKYPIFGNKIKENFKNGSARNELLTKTLDSSFQFFHRNTNSKLNEDCFRMILEYLDKESLKNVTQIGSLFFKSTLIHINKAEVTETNKFLSKP